MQEQNVKNHARLVPGYHYILSLLILIVLITSIVSTISACNAGNSLLLPLTVFLMAVILLVLGWYVRSFALKAQDRAIRAEENLRYFAITGNLLDSKLTVQQIVALRFAPNNEFVDLAHKAVEQELSPKQIKNAIQNWKADYYRV
jgi:hypothetical protein